MRQGRRLCGFASCATVSNLSTPSYSRRSRAFRTPKLTRFAKHSMVSATRSLRSAASSLRVGAILTVRREWRHFSYLRMCWHRPRSRLDRLDAKPSARADRGLSKARRPAHGPRTPVGRSPGIVSQDRVARLSRRSCNRDGSVSDRRRLGGQRCHRRAACLRVRSCAPYRCNGPRNPATLAARPSACTRGSRRQPVEDGEARQWLVDAR